MKAPKTRGLFRPEESLNSARIERMTPSMVCSSDEESIDGVIRQIRALFNDSVDVEICLEIWLPSPVSGPLCAPPTRVLAERLWALSCLALPVTSVYSCPSELWWFCREMRVWGKCASKLP